MQFKSYRLLMNKALRSLCSLSLLLLAWAAAAEEVESGTLASKERPGYLRTWIMEANGPLELVMASESALEPEILAQAAVGGSATSSEYVSVPAGRKVFSLRDGDKPVATGIFPIRAGEYSTIIALKKDGRWQIEAFDDVVKREASRHPVRMMNFAGDLQTRLSFSSGETRTISPRSVEEFAIARDIGGVRVEVLAADGGHPAQSSMELDGKSSRATYVIVRPDYRGRLLPELMQDGGVAGAADDEGSAGLSSSQEDFAGADDLQR
jgi:hypothetical protein